MVNSNLPSWVSEQPSTVDAALTNISPSWRTQACLVSAKILAVALVALELVGIALLAALYISSGPVMIGIFLGFGCSAIALIPLAIKYEMFCFTGHDFADIGHFMLFQTALTISLIAAGALCLQI